MKELILDFSRAKDHNEPFGWKHLLSGKNIFDLFNDFSTQYTINWDRAFRGTYRGIPGYQEYVNNWRQNITVETIPTFDPNTVAVTGGGLETIYNTYTPTGNVEWTMPPTGAQTYTIHLDEGHTWGIGLGNIYGGPI
jgi:hypothetical protein